MQLGGLAHTPIDSRHGNALYHSGCDDMGGLRGWCHLGNFRHLAEGARHGLAVFGDETTAGDPARVGRSVARAARQRNRIMDLLSAFVATRSVRPAIIAAAA